MLKKESVLVEDGVRDMAAAVEKVLRRHGKKIVDMQFTLRRVADIMMDLYGMIACISRATTAIEAQGQEGAAREVKLAKAFCGQAATRIRRIQKQFDHNDDELLKGLADDTYEAGGYKLDGALG
jgi:acyl-CoA dehydrogenase family protein 9